MTSLKEIEEDNILRERLEYLIKHVRDICPDREIGCKECLTYWEARNTLMMVFARDVVYPIGIELKNRTQGND